MPDWKTRGCKVMGRDWYRTGYALILMEVAAGVIIALIPHMWPLTLICAVAIVATLATLRSEGWWK